MANDSVKTGEYKLYREADLKSLNPEYIVKGYEQIRNKPRGWALYDTLDVEQFNHFDYWLNVFAAAVKRGNAIRKISMSVKDWETLWQVKGYLEGLKIK